MKHFTFTIQVSTNIDVDEQDVLDYISFESGAKCDISNDNPFIDEENEAEISDVDLY